jgi:hypothetical protein
MRITADGLGDAASKLQPEVNRSLFDLTFLAAADKNPGVEFPVRGADTHHEKNGTAQVQPDLAKA